MKTFIIYGLQNFKKILAMTFLFVFFYNHTAISSVISSVKNGNWNQKDVWDLNLVPVSSDQVIVNHSISFNSNINISNKGRLIINSNGILEGNNSITVENGAELLNYGFLNCINITNNGNVENYKYLISQNNFDNNSIFSNYGQMVAFNNVINNGGTITGVDGYVYSGNNVINNAHGYIERQSICSIDGTRNPLISHSGTYDEATVKFCSKFISLPVNLLSFDAKPDKGQIIIKWTTATEINCGFFCLQKSLDGINFNTIVSLTSKGNSTEIQEYLSLDENPANGINYYRLTETDIDGRTEILSIISVEYFNVENSISFYPNPTNGILKIDGLNEFGNNRIEILNNDGKHIINQELKENSINIESLNSGIYFIKVIDIFEKVQIQKIIKK